MKFCNITSTLFLLLLFFLQSSSSLKAQETNIVSMPAWVTLEYALQHFDQKNLGEALQLALKALSQKSIYPEAELLIAEIYAAEGETDLAINLYNKVLKFTNALSVPEEAFTVMYRLSEIYTDLGPNYYRKLEKLLLEIAKEQPEVFDPTYDLQRKSMIRVFADDGIDKILELYRLEKPVTIRAHNQLGWLYYLTGNYNESLKHSLFAVITIISEAAEELSRHDPEFTLPPISEFLISINKDTPTSNRIVSRYLVLDRFYESLYYLANAAYASGYIQSAKGIWETLTNLKAAGEYQRFSEEQLKSPSINNPIKIESKDLILPSPVG